MQENQVRDKTVHRSNSGGVGGSRQDLSFMQQKGSNTSVHGLGSSLGISLLLPQLNTINTFL